MGSSPSPRGADPSGSAPAAPGNAPVEPNTYRARAPAVGSWPLQSPGPIQPKLGHYSMRDTAVGWRPALQSKEPHLLRCSAAPTSVITQENLPNRAVPAGRGMLPSMEPVPIKQEPPPHKAASRRAAGQDRAQGAFRLAPAGCLPAGSRPLNLPASHS